MFCKHPHTGITISPDGSLSVCCMNQNIDIAHIKDVDSLYDIYRESELLNLMRADDQSTIDKLCQGCLRREQKGYKSRRQSYLTKDFTIDGKMRFLEFTTSNICNQTCSTCNSYFSSKWKDLDEEVHAHFTDRDSPHYVYSMTESDIQKIIDVLPDLEYVVIKGGEPFADLNNAKILRELATVNPSCNVSITSNFHKIPPIFLDIINDLQDVHVAASVDGIGEVYEWIRSTRFATTIETMEQFYQATGIKINIATTMSLYNVYTLWDILEFFIDKEYINEVNFVQFVKGPTYATAQQIPHDHRISIVDTFISNLDQLSEDQLIRVRGIPNIKAFANDVIATDVIYDETVKWIQYINMIRSFDIRNTIPQLRVFK